MNKYITNGLAAFYMILIFTDTNPIRLITTSLSQKHRR